MDGVVRGWGESEEEGHLAHREDDSSVVHQGVMSLSLNVSHNTEEKQGPFRISLKEKLSTRSSMLDESIARSYVPKFCRN